MAVMSSVQINNPNKYTLDVLASLAALAPLVTAVQTNKTFFTDLAQQLANVYALTAPEIAARDEAAALVANAQATLDSITKQCAEMQSEAAEVVNNANANAKMIREGVDQYKLSAQTKIDAQIADLTNRENDLANEQTALGFAQKKFKADQDTLMKHKNAIDAREVAIAKIEAAQKNLLAVAGQTATD